MLVALVQARGRPSGPALESAWVAAELALAPAPMLPRWLVEGEDALGAARTLACEMTAAPDLALDLAQNDPVPAFELDLVLGWYLLRLLASCPNLLTPMTVTRSLVWWVPEAMRHLLQLPCWTWSRSSGPTLRVDKEKRVHWGMWYRRNGLGLPYWASLPFLVLMLTSREVRASCTGYLFLLVPIAYTIPDFHTPLQNSMTIESIELVQGYTLVELLLDRPCRILINTGSKF